MRRDSRGYVNRSTRFGGLFDYEASLGKVRKIEKEMADPGFWSRESDKSKTIEQLKLLKSRTEPLREMTEAVEELSELLQIAGPGDVAEIESELKALEGKLKKLEVRTLLSSEYDPMNCYFSIQAGTGGTDACDWASMLLRMYTRWLDSKGFETRTLSIEPGEEAGTKSATLDVRGPYAFGYLKGEDGVHRLVRISPFDSNARRHTSFAAVEVVPQFEDVPEDIELKDEELKIEFARSSGPGGQHVNVTDSAVRIVHLPTGIVVHCQNERSQHQNRRTALAMLKAKLYQLRLKERKAELEKVTGAREEITWGNQIRSYILQPYTMVKDHRTNVETSSVWDVLDGDLDMFIESYLRYKAGLGGPK